LFYFIAYGSNISILISLSIFSIATAFNAAIIPGLFSKLIPTEVRYTVLALAFNVGFGFFGGLTPFFALLLIKKSGVLIMPAIYLATSALVTLIACYFLMKNVDAKYEIR
jgi:hypothetical protein